jgi:glycosyltransferase involved in cell wall biosynthesis
VRVRPDRGRRKTLCVVLHAPYPIGNGRAPRQVAVALAGGFDVDVVATRRPGEPHLASVEGARVYRLPLTHRRGRGLLGTAYEYFAFTLGATVRVARLALRRRYATAVIHNPPDFLIIAGLVPKLLGARLILDIQDLSSDMFAMRFGGRRGVGAVNRVLRSVERCAAGLADAVVTVHEPYRRELGRRGVPAHKTVVVMNSLDERLLPASIGSAGKAGFRVVYHGTVTPHYGVNLLVEAASRLAKEIAGFRLEIYGEGDALLDARTRADQLGLKDSVFFSGRYLPQREVLARVRGASVGVVPNLPITLNRFALSTKLFEYVALGVPVVAADLPTIREHFSDSEISFFRAGDADDLADALVRIAADRSAADARAREALIRYETYRWELNAPRYLAVLKGDVASEPM